MEILFNQFEIKSKMYSMTIYGITVIELLIEFQIMYFYVNIL